MQEKVSITVPPEQRDAIREALVEDIGVLADSMQGKLADMNRLSDVLARSHGGELRFEADSPGDRRTLREWAQAARNDGENILNDLDSYVDRAWWEHRARSQLGVSEQVLEALGDDGSSVKGEVPIVTFTREQRDALLDQLDYLVYRAVDHGIGTLAGERQIVEDALELWDELAEERESYTVMAPEGPSGWDGTRRSFRLARLSRRLLEYVEDGLTSDAPRVDPEIELRDKRLAARSACKNVFKALGEGR